MRLPKQPKPKNQLLNMTPMIDVVFLLIVFFIVSSNLIQQDVSVEMELPDAETGRQETPAENERLTINIPQTGQLFAGSVPVDSEQLRQLFAKTKAKSENGIEIRIRTGKDVPYRDVESVLVLAAESGIVNVTFAVKKDSR